MKHPLRFSAVVLLLLGPGLLPRLAWAQTRKAVPAKTATQLRPAQSTSRPKPVPPTKKLAAVPEPSGLDSTERYSSEPVPEPSITAAEAAWRIYSLTEHTPQPPGGMAGLQQYLNKHLRYPAQARQQRIEGKVFVNFVVGTDGRLSNLQVVKGIGAGCDEEALRVLGQMPAWMPGRQGHHAVSVSYTLPVVFKLTEPE